MSEESIDVLIEELQSRVEDIDRIQPNYNEEVSPVSKRDYHAGRKDAFENVLEKLYHIRKRRYD